VSSPPQPNPPTPVHDEGRSSRKRRAILQAATKAFLQQGYRGTSMDDIAALAGVSKQTVYKHFADKKRLFSEIVLGTVTEASDPVHNEVLKLTDSGDVEADLRDLARRQVATVMQPHLLQLRRLVIAEVGRFPELGRTFYEQGPERTIAALAEAFERLAERGELQVDDPLLAAAHFNWLIMSAPMNRAMLLGHDEAPAPAELDRYVNSAVRVFLAAYGRR
jgi:TetR/AcrR family transcriptional regulator, mexJK operon transcriptional repressor